MEPSEGVKKKKESRLNSLSRCFSMPMTNRACAASDSALTILYGGEARVYNAIPPEKAQVIMLIAAAAAEAGKVMTMVGQNAAESLAPMLTRSLSLQSSTATVGQSGTPASLFMLQAELPIARRQSLQRFLEKRRDRLARKAPYASARSLDMEVSEGSPKLT